MKARRNADSSLVPSALPADSALLAWPYRPTPVTVTRGPLVATTEIEREGVSAGGGGGGGGGGVERRGERREREQRERERVRTRVRVSVCVIHIVHAMLT